MVATGRKIFLGNVSPWNGVQVRKHIASREGYDVLSLMYDAHPPWVISMHRFTKPQLTAGFLSYPAVRSKIPWTLESPDKCLKVPMRVLRLTCGCQFIVGPPTRMTTYGLLDDTGKPKREYSVWHNLCLDMHGAEIGHVKRLAELLSLNIAWNDFYFSDTQQKRSSLVQFFEESDPKLLREIPPCFFWEIDSSGMKRVWDGTKRKKCIYVPMMPHILLEMSARGYAIGYTDMPYLDEVLRLRDELLPGHPMDFCQISFNWSFRDDPIDALLDEWRRKIRKEVPERAGNIRRHWANNPTAEKIRRYWANNPTAASFNLLGGELNPQFEERTL